MKNVGAIVVAVLEVGFISTVAPFGCGSVANKSGADGGAGHGGTGGAAGGPSDASVPVDAAASLPAVGAGHLQAWLTADRGVTCTAGEITLWTDQSSNHRDANHGSHKGPQCPPTLHALAGVNLPYFSSPGTTAPFVDETLDFNLAFLTGTDFTIFVVERRWADRSFGGGNNAFLIGTDMPNDLTPSCPAAGYQIDLGYSYYDGFPTLNYESVCYRPYSGTRGQVPAAAALPPSPTVVDMLRLDHAAAASPTVWQNGVKVNGGGASGGPGSGFVGGSIGRAFGVDAENRFQGDIAEIVIFDVALSDAEAQQMLAYFKLHWQL
jgi:hypothetical protein